MFYRDQFILNGQLYQIVGAYYGIVFDVIYLNGTPQNVNDMPKSKKKRKLLARFLIGIIIWLLPIYFMNEVFMELNIFKGMNTYLISNLLRYALPQFVFTFFLFSIYKLIFKKFNLTNNPSNYQEN